jgi:hypothetical protein
MESHAYALDMTTWPVLLKKLGIRAANVLRRAGLPDDLFARGVGTPRADRVLPLLGGARNGGG